MDLSSNYKHLTLEGVRWIEKRIPVYGTLTERSGYGLIIYHDKLYYPAIIHRGSGLIADSPTYLPQEVVSETLLICDPYIPMWSFSNYYPQIKEAIKEHLFRKEMTNVSS